MAPDSSNVIYIYTIVLVIGIKKNKLDSLFNIRNQQQVCDSVAYVVFWD